MGVTHLEDLGEVCVSVGEHGVDAVDGILGLARGASLGFGLQYWQQNTWGSRKGNTITNHRKYYQESETVQQVQRQP